MSISDKHLSMLFLFKDVDPESVRHLTDICPIKEFSAGEILLTPGEINHSMYVVVEGSASVRLGSASSAPIAHIEVGESVGEMSALDTGIAPSAYVKVEKAMKAMVINHRILIQLINQSHGVARNLLFLLSKRVRSGNAKVTNSQKLQKEFEQHANVDSLTGIYNRRWIDNYFKRLLRRDKLKGFNSNFAILLADVDHFKKFNDTFGHLAGDQALRSVATALKMNTRPTDIVARYGGEEFLIILPNTSPSVALMVADRVLSGVRNQAIAMGETPLPGVTISVGIASLQPDDDFDSLILAADRGLFKAKENGRNQVAVERFLSVA